jgi:hypothetical protein
MYIAAIETTPSLKKSGGVGNDASSVSTSVVNSFCPNTKKYSSLTPSPTTYNVCLVYADAVNPDKAFSLGLY